MNLIKKGSLLTLVCLLCFSLFSFKSINSNEKQLSNIDNFNNVIIKSKTVKQEKMAIWAAVGRTAVKAWQKSSREVVYAAVALWPLTRAKDNLVNLEIDNNLIQESKFAKL